MISPEQVDEQTSENEHGSSLTEEKQALPASEEKRPWLNPLMRVISVVLALAGSFVAFWAISNLLISMDMWLLLLVILVYAAFCAVLFRSMWAALIVPIALDLGALLAMFLATVPEGDWNSFAAFGVGIMLLISLPALIGATIGGFFGVAWKEGKMDVVRNNF